MRSKLKAKTLVLMITVGAVLSIFSGAALGVPHPAGSGDARARQQPHGPSSAVVCQPLFVCDIVLDQGETVISMATGDSVRWILNTAVSGIDATTPHVLVKPTQYGLRTNLIITTDRRVCYVILASTPRSDQGYTNFYYRVARVAHIEENVRGKSALPNAAGILQVDPEKLDFAYHMHGDRTIMPVGAMNDGVRTYIEMPTGLQNMPAVFAIGNDGSDTLVNYRFRGRFFILDGVPQAIALVEGSGRHQRRTIIERGN